MSQGFVDYYELLQINKDAETDAIQRVYRVLASRYHPDNKETGNLERFLLIKEAYGVLSDPGKRKDYDKAADKERENPIPVFLTKEFTEGIDSEANRRLGVLCLLYNRRKSNPSSPALSVLELENMMFLPREHLTFTIWYLKAKKWIQSDDKSSLQITADGIDYLESSLPQSKTIHKLLQAADSGATRQGPQVFTTGWADVHDGNK
jgi:curved DNA-binding protein CbpA